MKDNVRKHSEDFVKDIIDGPPIEKLQSMNIYYIGSGLLLALVFYDASNRNIFAAIIDVMIFFGFLVLAARDEKGKKLRLIDRFMDAVTEDCRDIANYENRKEG